MAARLAPVAVAAAALTSLMIPAAAVAARCAYQEGRVEPGWTPTLPFTMTNQSIYHTNSNNANYSYTAYRLRDNGTVAWSKDTSGGTLFSPYNSIDVLRRSRMWYRGSTWTFYTIEQNALGQC